MSRLLKPLYVTAVTTQNNVYLLVYIVSECNHSLEDGDLSHLSIKILEDRIESTHHHNMELMELQSNMLFEEDRMILANIYNSLCSFYSTELMYRKQNTHSSQVHSESVPTDVTSTRESKGKRAFFTLQENFEITQKYP